MGATGGGLDGEDSARPNGPPGWRGEPMAPPADRAANSAAPLPTLESGSTNSGRGFLGFQSPLCKDGQTKAETGRFTLKQVLGSPATPEDPRVSAPGLRGPTLARTRDVTFCHTYVNFVPTVGTGAL